MTAITSETKPKKNPENYGRKKWLSWRFLGLSSWLLVIIGLILTPFVVGLPILVIGWMLMIFNFFYSKYKFWVPQKYQEALKEKINKEYEPYKPAAQSLGSIISDMLKIALLFFIGSIIVLLIIYLY